MLGHYQTEDRVPKKLQPLIGRQPTPLIGERAMSERTIQQLGIDAHPELSQQGSSG
jgi:hypothetical protein